MAGRGRLSRLELIGEKRRAGFVGRHGELAAFRSNLVADPESGPELLFHVSGPSGVGKSTLVRQWAALARKAGAVTAWVDEGCVSVVEAMESISAQLASQGATLKGFDKQLGLYRQRRHEAEAVTPDVSEPGASGSPEVSAPVPPSASSTFVSQLGLAGAGMVPGLGVVAGAVDPNRVAASMDRWRAALSARLRSHDDVQLVMSPVQVLTPVFLEELAEAAGRQEWVVLLFDTYERTGPVLDTWLRDLALSDRYGELPTNILVVLAGQGQLDPRCWGEHMSLIATVPLDVFTEAEARQFLATRQVTDERVVEVILQLSGRLPVLLSLLAESRPTSVEEIGDASGTAVERFLKWETNPTRRAAAQACALPQELNEDIYRAAVEPEAVDLFDWLRGLSFVTDRSGRCHYHQVVRTTMLRLQRTKSPARWHQQHTHLADTFRTWRHQLQSSAPAQDVRQWWDDSRWREHKLQETYHRLCATPEQALADALRELLDAYDYATAALRRWAQMLAQAGHDTSTSTLAHWGQQILAALEDTSGPGIAALTLLLHQDTLDVPGRALAFTLRGRDRRDAGRYERAVSDYEEALTLVPGFARAYFGRGETYRMMGRNDDALTDFNHAIELDPADTVAIASRGQTYRAMGRYDEALTDLNRAIELDPSLDWAIADRGETHRLMGRYEDALTDLNRAIELDPNYTWAITNRSEAYRLMGRYEDALTDLNRAIELDPNLEWVIAFRGDTYRLMGRYEDALTDLNRAIELDPNYDFAIASRGETHRLTGRYEDALTDFTRAIQLQPDTDWVIAERGEANRFMGRYEEALTDFNRAIQLDPDYDFAIAERGETYRLMGRYEEALTDFNRAIQLDPDYDFAIASRGQTYRHMERYEEALTDLNRAIELDPNYSWAIVNRGQIYRHMGHFEEALTDLNRAIELDPNYSWAIADRGETHRLTGRYEDALTDFTRAIQLQPDTDWVIAERGETYRRMGRYEEALTDFNHAIERGFDPLFLVGRGQIYRAMGQYDNALTDLNRAIYLDPNEGWAQYEKALVLHALGEPGQEEWLERAAEVFRRVSEEAGQEAAWGKANLFVVMCAMPRWEQATQCLDDFLTGEPSTDLLVEAVRDLEELADAMPSLAERLLPFRERIEEARQQAG
ncbi:tetratricopeptide repeat protein [Streptomyces sp. NPDC020845]|uniref:tetratricopeptide repeat protein n=1 Tax=Streptomyces sp. NPDC020845 TaxID=3365096 RepID=UPI00379336A8